MLDVLFTQMYSGVVKYRFTIDMNILYAEAKKITKDQ